jgi:hypothetical protein
MLHLRQIDLPAARRMLEGQIDQVSEDHHLLLKPKLLGVRLIDLPPKQRLLRVEADRLTTEAEDAD